MNLDDRMKFYEGLYAKTRLMPLLPTFARMDGRAFHSFTRGLNRPFDENFSNLMVETTKFLVDETNAIIGYTQSDEITLMWHTEEFKSQIFFNHRASKMISILASMTSVYFNRLLPKYLPDKANKLPLFDARVWTVPTLEEAVNVFLWRERDATKNSISMASQSVYSHKQLMYKNSSEMQEMLFKKGINWNDYSDAFKRGSYIQRRKFQEKFTVDLLAKLPLTHTAHKNEEATYERSSVVRLDLPPLGKITNRIEALFRKEDPLVA